MLPPSRAVIFAILIRLLVPFRDLHLDFSFFKSRFLPFFLFKYFIFETLKAFLSSFFPLNLTVPFPDVSLFTEHQFWYLRIIVLNQYHRCQRRLEKNFIYFMVGLTLSPCGQRVHSSGYHGPPLGYLSRWKSLISFGLSFCWYVLPIACKLWL